MHKMLEQIRKMSGKGINMRKDEEKIQRKLRQIEDKIHMNDLQKLMKKKQQGSTEELAQMSKRDECMGVI